MKTIKVLIGLLFIINTAFALEDSPSNRAVQAERYLQATPPKDLFADMAEQMARTLPLEQRQQFKDMLTKNLDLEAVTLAIKQSMEKHFTADELKALADFYGSDIGRSAMKKFGVYMADVMPSVQAEMMKAITKTKAQLPDPKK